MVWGGGGTLYMLVHVTVFVCLNYILDNVLVHVGGSGYEIR